MTNCFRFSVILLLALMGIGPATFAGDSHAHPRSPTRLKGVDVSQYQGKINWDRLRSSDISFVYIRATHGDEKDERFDDNWAGADSDKLFRGAYHYFIPALEDAEHGVQARVFVDAVGRLGDRDLPPMLDWEDRKNPLSPEDNIRAGRRWLREVEAATGKIPVIYTNPNYWETILGNPTGFERYPLYISHYKVDRPRVPEGWDTWVFWQMTGGSLRRNSGIPSVVDLDVFNGSIRQLAQFTSDSNVASDACTGGDCDRLP